MKLIKKDVEFVVSHLRCVFAPTKIQWVNGHHIYPLKAASGNLVRALKEETPASLWGHVLTSVETDNGKKLKARGFPSIQRIPFEDEEIEHQEWKYWLAWDRWKVYKIYPPFESAIPQYLKDFIVEGHKFRQVVESPRGCTWFGLTYDNKLWEIDKC